jgi:nitronate monooxygenase
MSWPRHALIDLLGIAHPIIQAPMAGASTAALAAAVSNAGALGGFGGTDSSPDELRAIRHQTNKPFIINLYLNRTDRYVPAEERVAALKTALALTHTELDAGEVPDSIDLFGRFDSQVAIVIEERAPVLSSQFGAPDAKSMHALKAIGTSPCDGDHSRRGTPARVCGCRRHHCARE